MISGRLVHRLADSGQVVEGAALRRRCCALAMVEASDATRPPSPPVK
jgi:hypothetical protein